MNHPVGDLPPIPRDGEKPVPDTAAPERARVLLVDDDERNLLALKTVLEDLGEVVLARSGEEALRHLLKNEFAVILLDVYMPGMDGYETAQIIRGREQTKGIPIVFLSAVNKEAEHLMRGYSMGAVDYVFKPVDPVILRSKVAALAAPRRRYGAAPGTVSGQAPAGTPSRGASAPISSTASAAWCASPK